MKITSILLFYFTILFILFFLILAFPVFSQAGQLEELTNFFLNPDYDLYQREETSATLKVISQKAYFWVDILTLFSLF